MTSAVTTRRPFARRMDVARRTALLAAVLAAATLPAPGADLPAVTLADLLAWQQAHPTESRPSATLKPEWIGEIKRTHVVGDTSGIYRKPDPPRPLRLNFGGIEPAETPGPAGKSATTPAVVLLAARRTTAGGLSYLGSDRAVYRKSLPTAAEIAATTSPDRLHRWFGPQHGWTDGWGGPDGMHWTEGWTFLTPGDGGRLRFLSIFAHVHGAKGQPAVVDILTIHQADLRQADPDSAAEARRFPAAAEIHRREEVARIAKLKRVPLPLRDLLAAEEAPDDTDRAALRTCVNRFRAKPDARLIEQLLARVHEDPVRFTMLLEELLLERDGAATAPWQPEPRRQAIGFLIDALPATKRGEALFDACVVALKALGGGKLRLNSGAAAIDVAVGIGKDSQSVTGSNADHDPALIALIQQELRRRLR